MSEISEEEEFLTPAQRAELERLREAKRAKARPRPNGDGKFLDGAADCQAKVELECAATINPKPVLWLWKDWLARGKLHIIAGRPGVGKSTIALKIAAAISCGGRWPDGSEARLGTVVIWSGEDDPADTITPRLEAAGADLKRVHIVKGTRDGKGKRPFDPARDVPALCQAIKDIGGAALIVIDPVVMAIAADSHKNAETRRGLQPLVDLAAELGAALFGVTHFTKGTEGCAPIDRVTGSLAFGALGRVVMVAAKKQDGDDGSSGARVLMLAKSNIGPDEGGFEYELQNTPLYSNPEILASVVVWGSRIEGNARDVLAEAETVKAKDEGELTAFREARDFLLDFLMEGPRPANECKAAAAEAALSWATVKRAKLKLGIASVKDGMRGSWVWSLTAEVKTEGAHQNPKGLIPCVVSPFANHESLRGLSEADDDGLEGEI